MTTILENISYTSHSIKSNVLIWLYDECSDDEDVKRVLEELQQYGCQSGAVNNLVNHADTAEFYDRYQSEIEELAADFEESTGKSRAELFEHDSELVWFAFESVAFRIYSELFYS